MLGEGGPVEEHPLLDGFYDTLASIQQRNSWLSGGLEAQSTALEDDKNTGSSAGPSLPPINATTYQRSPPADRASHLGSTSSPIDNVSHSTSLFPLRRFVVGDHRQECSGGTVNSGSPLLEPRSSLDRGNSRFTHAASMAETTHGNNPASTLRGGSRMKHGSLGNPCGSRARGFRLQELRRSLAGHPAVLAAASPTVAQQRSMMLSPARKANKTAPHAHRPKLLVSQRDVYEELLVSTKAEPHNSTPVFIADGSTSAGKQAGGSSETGDKQGHRSMGKKQSACKLMDALSESTVNREPSPKPNAEMHSSSTRGGHPQSSQNHSRRSTRHQGSSLRNRGSHIVVEEVRAVATRRVSERPSVVEPMSQPMTNVPPTSFGSDSVCPESPSSSSAANFNPHDHTKTTVVESAGSSARGGDGVVTTSSSRHSNAPSGGCGLNSSGTHSREQSIPSSPQPHPEGCDPIVDFSSSEYLGSGLQSYRGSRRGSEHESDIVVSSVLGTPAVNSIFCESMEVEETVSIHSGRHSVRSHQSVSPPVSGRAESSLRRHGSSAYRLRTATEDDKALERWARKSSQRRHVREVFGGQ